MPAPIPKRNRNVYLVGAGVSCAMGLPNTPSLLTDVQTLASHSHWLMSEELPERLQEAFRFFYPDAKHPGFQPDVVDFFSALKTYVDLGSGFSGAFRDAPSLYRDLKFAIAHLVIERSRACDARLSQGHAYLEEILQPGNIVITSNWDVVLERYASQRGIPTRLSGTDERELVILKLHGSVDWCLGGLRKAAYPNSDYCMLSERLFGSHPYTVPLPKQSDLGARNPPHPRPRTLERHLAPREEP